MCLPCWIIIQSCHFDSRINKPLTRCLNCVSFSVHVISTHYVRKGSWAFYLNYPQINGVVKSDHMDRGTDRAVGSHAIHSTHGALPELQHVIRIDRLKGTLYVLLGEHLVHEKYDE